MSLFWRRRICLLLLLLLLMMMVKRFFFFVNPQVSAQFTLQTKLSENDEQALRKKYAQKKIT